MQKKKHKVTKQVYRVKKDGRLIKNSDLTQRIERLTVEETSASSIEEIAPDVEYVSNNIAERKPSSAGGQVWQNHLNYPGSSAQAITIKATPVQTHFKWNNSWSWKNS